MSEIDKLAARLLDMRRGFVDKMLQAKREDERICALSEELESLGARVERNYGGTRADGVRRQYYEQAFALMKELIDE